MVAGLALLAMTLGFCAAALGDAFHAQDVFWSYFFLALIVVGMSIFTWVTIGLSTYLSDDPVDRVVDEYVDLIYDDSWHDHHSGEIGNP